MDQLLIILGPGSMLAYLFLAVAENILTYVFDPKYYQIGKSKSFLINLNNLTSLHSQCKGPEVEGTQLYRLPIGLGFVRLLVKQDRAEIKMPYFFWLAQSFIIFTAILNYKHNQTENLWGFIAGCEFLFGGFHLQSYFKAKKLKQALTK